MKYKFILLFHWLLKSPVNVHEFGNIGSRVCSVEM